MACKEISTVDMKRMLFDYEDVQIVDVREVNEYREGHIEGSTLIPLGILPHRTDAIAKDKPVVVVCRSGNRSKEACEMLRQRGFNVMSLRGGLSSWHTSA
ncbi:rhodanese-like domain-containing protein [Alicyclobacillus tolerans]|uniref:rhodanese-like domain-containing protein n=1 Tax=Alicyclobacillus tolerans TaxID=90970 RepID=UPI001F390AE6|nr:rhodanese-like domain-containing protein [Alicyclobacillus tolerans]MCF8566257.1 rhodanese-like domain-containing protein [Alicyclobacillus tolerans]